jgi:hypothetical protein
MEHGGQIVRQHERLFLARTVRDRRELGDVARILASATLRKAAGVR